MLMKFNFVFTKYNKNARKSSKINLSHRIPLTEVHNQVRQ